MYTAQRRLREGVGGARSGAIAQRGNRTDETVASDNDPVGPMAGRGDEHRDPEVESHPEVGEALLSRSFRDVRAIQPMTMGLEREKGFEPSTFCLGSRCSTPELLPLGVSTPPDGPLLHRF